MSTTKALTLNVDGGLGSTSTLVFDLSPCEQFTFSTAHEGAGNQDWSQWVSVGAVPRALRYALTVARLNGEVVETGEVVPDEVRSFTHKLGGQYVHLCISGGFLMVRKPLGLTTSVKLQGVFVYITPISLIQPASPISAWSSYADASAFSRVEPSMSRRLGYVTSDSAEYGVRTYGNMYVNFKVPCPGQYFVELHMSLISGTVCNELVNYFARYACCNSAAVDAYAPSTAEWITVRNSEWSTESTEANRVASASTVEVDLYNKDTFDSGVVNFIFKFCIDVPEDKLSVFLHLQGHATDTTENDGTITQNDCGPFEYDDVKIYGFVSEEVMPIAVQAEFLRSSLYVLRGTNIGSSSTVRTNWVALR